MGVVVCPKHHYASWVTCCRHVAAAIDGNQPFAGALHGPRKTFRWCACPECAVAPQIPFCGVASAIPNPLGVCIHCFYNWWSVHYPDAPGSPPVEWQRPQLSVSAVAPGVAPDAEPGAAADPAS